MANAKSTTPALRFKGFDEEWKERKLGECFKERQERSSKGELISVTTNSGIKKFEDLGRHDNSSEDKSNYKRVVAGDIAYNSMRMWQGASGYSPYNGILSPAYTVAIPNSDIDSRFFAYMFKKPEMIHTFQLRSQGVTSDTWNMKFPTFREIEVSVPKKTEQKQIAKHFSHLDSLIALQRRKLVKMQNVKKAMLQKMFPARGSTTPQIRFAGFTEPWQEQKLGDLAEIVRGASPRPIKDPRWFNSDSEIGWLRISDVTEQDGRIQYLEQRLSVEGQEHTRVLTEPHLLLSIAATVGKPLVNYVPTGVHDGFLIFLNPQFDREFMFQWLEMFRPQWSQYGQPGSQVNLNSDLVKNKTLLLPDEKEQIKIGAYFKHLDTRISLQQRKLEKLQNVKKACLDAMFV